MDSVYQEACQRLAADRSDENAWQEFYEAFYPRLARAMRLKTSSKEDAEDVAQYAFSELWRDQKVLCTPDKIPNWLYTVASNEAVNIHRRKRARGNLDQISVGDVNICLHSGPQEYAETQDDLRLLNAVFPLLNDGQREVISLRYFMEMDGNALGLALGCEPGAARKRLCDALKALRALMVPRDDGVAT